MTLLEVMEQISKAKPSERFSLADELFELLDENEKILASGYLGEYIVTLEADDAEAARK
jgi:hypothetical protein